MRSTIVKTGKKKRLGVDFGKDEDDELSLEVHERGHTQQTQCFPTFLVSH